MPAARPEAVSLAPRCVLCGARAVTWRGELATCLWCGARWPRGCCNPWDRLAALLAEGAVHTDPARLGGLLLDDYTFRSAALANGLAFAPDAGPVIHGHRMQPARGHLRRIVPGPARNVTLVVLSRAADRALEDLLAATAGHFAATIVVVDAMRASPHTDATVLACPLDRFDVSRNQAQAAVRTPWVLHLDTDERLDRRTLASVGGLAAMADGAGLHAVGFPRRNLVDGALSDLWPDVQYRLVRRTVRFRGRVHERPDACDDWRRTMIALGMPIEHRLTGAHVAARQARYDALGQSAERAAEAEALQRPYSA